MNFIGHMMKRDCNEYVIELLTNPFLDKISNKWTLIAITGYISSDYRTIHQSKILEFDSEEEAKVIKVGSKVTEHTYYECA